ETDVSSGISNLLAAGADPSTFKHSVRRFKNVLSGSSLVSARYSFASLENLMMFDYLMPDRTEDDCRYRLAKLLLDDETAATFDIALTDAPPRLTAGAINAFCASTHLLVPTVYDIVSAEAVGTFLNSVHVLRDHLNHGIDFLGVVGTLTMHQGQLNRREQRAKEIAENQIKKTWGSNYHFFDRHIPRRAAIAEAAGESLAYDCKDAVVKDLF